MSRSTFVVALGALGLATALSADAGAQVVVPVPFPPPPPSFVATVQPVYYEGHASYWYGGHWHWRDTHGWHAYDREPGYLHDHRAHEHWAPRPHYEHRR
jgi:hypothetical protein